VGEKCTCVGEARRKPKDGRSDEAKRDRKRRKKGKVGRRYSKERAGRGKTRRQTVSGLLLIWFCLSSFCSEVVLLVDRLIGREEEREGEREGWVRVG